MSRTAHLVTGLAVVGIASCQLVSGVGDYTFEPSGAGGSGTGTGTGILVGGGGAGGGLSLSWAYQLKPTNTVTVTSLFPADGQLAVVLGHFTQELQFDDRLGSASWPQLTSTGAEDGFLFVAGPSDDARPPVALAGTGASIIRPQAIAFPDQETLLLAGTFEGILGGLACPTQRCVFIAESAESGGWLRTFPYVGDAEITGLVVDPPNGSLFITGHTTGAIPLADDVAIPIDRAGFVARFALSVLEQSDDPKATWMRTLDGMGSQRVVAALPRGNGVVVYGDYQNSLLFRQDMASSTQLDDMGQGGSLFLLALDAGGALPEGERVFLRTSGGDAVAASLAASDDGRYLMAADFVGTIVGPGGAPIAKGDRDLYVTEYDDFNEQTYVAGFGETTGIHRMGGAGYVDDGSGGPSVIAFAGTCAYALTFAGVPSQGSTEDVCLGFLAEAGAEKGDYQEITLARLGDEGEQDHDDQRAVALVTRGSSAILYGVFQGTLIDASLYRNDKDGVDDAFVMAFDFSAGL